jgi:hypothetical protein
MADLTSSWLLQTWRSQNTQTQIIQSNNNKGNLFELNLTNGLNLTLSVAVGIRTAVPSIMNPLANRTPGTV